MSVFQGCFLLIFYLMGSTRCICEGPYLNLCNEYEEEHNTTEVEEAAETICDCQQVRFCYLVELSQECNSTIVTLTTNENITIANLQCNIQPLESRIKTPAYELVNQTETEIAMNILTGSDFGKFKISCAFYEILEEVNSTTTADWEILSINPVEITIDDEVELELTVKQSENSPSVWCFVKTSDNSTEVLSLSWLSDTRIKCKNFKPVTPGVFQVSLHSTITLNMFDKSINVNVASKSPVAEKAEYSAGFETITIYFDENVDLHSSCVSVFSKESLESFGSDFECKTRGNTVVVKMGNKFHIVDNVLISSGNKICRAGASLEFCLSSPSVNLTLSKPKLLGSTLSLYMNPTCGPSQKYINVKLTHSKNSNYVTQNQTHQPRTSGKTQRKNLIMWRAMRKIQSNFSSPLNIPQSDTTEVISLLESLSPLGDLDIGKSSLGSASVLVFVKSTQSSSSIVAEASVSFCEGFKLHQYKWIVNKENVFENGKILIVENLAPGKYIIKCLVVGYDSNEVLGQGWTTIEILPSSHKVIITPLEVTAGSTDNITLNAVGWTGNSISWTCKTTLGKPCTTTNQKLASEVLDLTSPKLSIPGGTFPIGDYVWSVENAEGANTAKVFIKPGNRPALDVEVSTFVKPSEEVVLRGSIKKGQRDCRAWWSSVREKGFNYLNLNNMREKEEISNMENFDDEVDLVIPPSSGNWRGVESDSMYMFKLQVFCPHSATSRNGSLDYIKVPLSVYNPSNISAIVIEPLEGFAMVTNFMVSGGEVDASDPLVFEWSYVDSCYEETPIKRGAFSRNFSTYLPPGDIKLKLKVCDVRGICSTTSTPTVSVIQESEFPAENIQTARSQIELLLLSGDTLEAFGLAVTVLKSLALIHEAESREMIFSTVGEGIKAKIKDLTRRTEVDSKAAKSSLEFCERAMAVAKYFRKGSNILNELTEFRNKILRVMSSKKSL